MSGIYDIAADGIDGRKRSMEEFRGQVLLIVNTASRCGFTPQYEGLEALHGEYRDRGLVVLGFPCNQFLNEEPGGNAEIAEFCTLHFQVSFPMFAKVDVRGPKAHPLYRFLTNSKSGIAGTRDVKWNFTKFLVDRQGTVVARYGPFTKPRSLRTAIEKLL